MNLPELRWCTRLCLLPVPPVTVHAHLERAVCNWLYEPPMQCVLGDAKRESAADTWRWYWLPTQWQSHSGESDYSSHLFGFHSGPGLFLEDEFCHFCASFFSKKWLALGGTTNRVKICGGLGPSLTGDRWSRQDLGLWLSRDDAQYLAALALWAANVRIPWWILFFLQLVADKSHYLVISLKYTFKGHLWPKETIWLYVYFDPMIFVFMGLRWNRNGSVTSASLLPSWGCYFLPLSMAVSIA